MFKKLYSTKVVFGFGSLVLPAAQPLNFLKIKHKKKLTPNKNIIKESFATLVEVYSMSMLPNVMILTSSTKAKEQHAVPVKVVCFIRGRNQPQKNVLVSQSLTPLVRSDEKKIPIFLLIALLLQYIA